MASLISSASSSSLSRRRISISTDFRFACIKRAFSALKSTSTVSFFPAFRCPTYSRTALCISYSFVFPSQCSTPSAVIFRTQRSETPSHSATFAAENNTFLFKISTSPLLKFPPESGSDFFCPKIFHLSRSPDPYTLYSRHSTFSLQKHNDHLLFICRSSPLCQPGYGQLPPAKMQKSPMI